MTDCPKCGKSFESEEAMEQHLEDYTHEEEDETISLKERVMTSNLTTLAVIAAILIGGGFLVFNAVSGSSGSSGDVSGTISLQDDPVIGQGNTSVAIAYFGDYGCPLCNRFEQRIFPELQKQVIDTGEAKFVKKNFPIVTDQSPRLAVASQEVWEQVGDSNPEAFWEWHALVYDNQGSEHSGWATEERILGITRQVDGIDVDKVENAMSQDLHSQEVRQDLREGRNSGVRGTPTFIIYNTDTGSSEKLVGPQPVHRFRSAIQKVS